MLDVDLEDKNQLLDKTNYTIKNAIDLSTKKTFWDKLLVNKFLLSLRKSGLLKKNFCWHTNIKYQI